MAEVLVSVFFFFCIFGLERIENVLSCVKIAISLPGKAGKRKLINEKYKAIEKINPEPQNPVGLSPEPHFPHYPL